MTGERLLGVAGDGGLQRPLGAPLRRPDLDPRAPELAEPRPVQVGVGRLERHQHQLGPAEGVVVGVAEVEPLQRPAHQLGPVEVLGLVDHEAPASHHPAPAHEEHLHGGLQGVVHQPDHVEVLVAGAHHLLGLDRFAHRGQAVAQPGGPLVVELAGRGRHLLFEAVEHRVAVALQEAQQLGHHLGVVVGGHLAHARPRALLDVVQQARLAQAGVAAELAVGAGADRERAQQQVEGVADGVGVAVGTEVAVALAAPAPHHHGPGPLVEGGHAQERVRLVVGVAHVEPGPVALDERELEHQSLDLVCHLDPFHRNG